MEQVSEDVLARKRPDLKLHNKIPETWPLYSPVGTAMKGQVQSCKDNEFIV
ncbi:hypothetical protein GBAR_LOCUS10225 [Geodia barretti]|uniref:Uncharacterized protein n=1 Tax=Geodia barretti TaxID=519541 RepID=A0AA35RS19_GEOBA|nr:hypothetical protein GBAR_LOCUS10225 [Geodia barretti]